MLPINGNAQATTLLATTSLMKSAVQDTVVKKGVVADNYLDQNSLNAVKAMGRNNDPQALKEIAKKFEGMFVQQMLKSMRDANAVFSDGDMFSSDEVKFHQELMDQQMVLNLTSGKGIGLATSMYQQMQKMLGNKAPAESSSNTLITPPVIKQDSFESLKPLASHSPQPPELLSRAGIKTHKSTHQQTPAEFIAALKPFAEKAAGELNVNTDVLLAQAALETGWGKHVLQDTQGNSSFNMFNIKKSASWEGKSIGVNSVEFTQGVAQQERSEFKQYENYLASFSDYVALMKTNPRYQKALDVGSDSKKYADALQKSGYATDPEYAAKIKRLLASDTIRSAVNSQTAAELLPEMARGSELNRG